MSSTKSHGVLVVEGFVISGWGCWLLVSWLCDCVAQAQVATIHRIPPGSSFPEIRVSGARALRLSIIMSK